VTEIDALSPVAATLQVRSRREAGQDLPVLVWRFPSPVRAVASAPHGGGLGSRRWVINAQVPTSYTRRDPAQHLAKLAVSLGLAGRGVGMLTAADARSWAGGSDGGVEVASTVGLEHPTWAAAPDAGDGSRIGTINTLALIPVRLSDAALVNAVATATEAKTQALVELGVPATGTATDAVCVVCPEEGKAEPFGGPRSVWGARLARAVHSAVAAGTQAWYQTR
jgi:adenosylcobinamide amidohydrolase